MKIKHIPQMFPQISRYPSLNNGYVHRYNDFLGANTLLFATLTNAALLIGRKDPLNRNCRKNTYCPFYTKTVIITVDENTITIDKPHNFT